MVRLMEHIDLMLVEKKEFVQISILEKVLK